MTLVILVVRLVFNIIPTMYFSHGIEKSIIGKAILIEDIIKCFLYEIMCDQKLIASVIKV